MPTISPEAYIADPYAYFAEQRRIDPVRHVELFCGPVWLVTGFAEAEAMMKDPRFIRDGRRFSAEADGDLPGPVRRALALKGNMILVRDAPFHGRVRRLLGKAFTPAMIRSLRPRLEATCREVLDEMRGRQRHDLIADYAYRFPMYAISELLGVPREDRHFSQRWSEALIRFIDFHRSLEELLAASEDLLHAEAYFRELLARKRRAPALDLLSELAALQAQGGPISEDEIVASCVLLLSAGHETTVNLIANGYWLLFRHPEQLARLRREPGLLGNAVEEVLRFEPPALTSSRWVAEDLELDGRRLREGDFVIIALGGANRDPRVTEEPERFRIDRSPVRHLSFASGPHYCLGAHLARLEGEIGIGRLIDAFVEPRLLEEPRWKDSIALRGFESLRFEAELRLDAGARQDGALETLA